MENGTGSGFSSRSNGPIVVTGAAGFAGGHLIDRLAGQQPIVAWHRPDHPPPAALAGVSWQAVDLLDRASVRRAVAAVRPSGIFHLAGASRVDTSWDSVVPHLETNAIGTHNLLESVREVDRTCRVLVVSSAMIYRPANTRIDEDAPLQPSNPYGLTKLAQDQLARRAAVDDGLPVVLARPFNHAGARQHPGFVISSFARQVALIEAGKAAGEMHVGNLDAQRDITDVRDVVEAYDCLMRKGVPGRPYNVCSGHAIRIGELLDQLLVLGQTRGSIQVIVDPKRLRPNDDGLLIGDPGRMQRELGWMARRSISDTLRATLDWWRTQVR
jgi:GDP-4-dehydro-6-deoxy-D-mannose reductase